MTTYTIIDRTASEELTFTMTEPHGVTDLLSKLEEVMYVFRECTPRERFWTGRLIAGHTVEWSYHGLEFMGMYFDKETNTFSIWDRSSGGA